MSGKKEGLIEHHIHYKEIDGYDETVWMSWSDHVKLHLRLRKEGKCNIPVEELTKISQAAHWRTEKGIKARAEQGEKQREYMEDYYKENKEHILEGKKKYYTRIKRTEEYKEKRRLYARKYRAIKREGKK